MKKNIVVVETVTPNGTRRSCFPTIDVAEKWVAFYNQDNPNGFARILDNHVALRVENALDESHQSIPKYTGC